MQKEALGNIKLKKKSPSLMHYPQEAMSLPTPSSSRLAVKSPRRHNYLDCGVKVKGFKTELVKAKALHRTRR